MARFHLNVFNEIDTFDEEGIQFPDVAAAKTAAITSAREMMADHLINGHPIAKTRENKLAN
jgi:hypothetical protein